MSCVCKKINTNILVLNSKVISHLLLFISPLAIWTIFIRVIDSTQLVGKREKKKTSYNWGTTI